MTDRELMQMTLKFCEDIGELSGPYPYVNGTPIVVDSRKVSKALRDRLAQPEPSYLQFSGAMHVVCKCDKCLAQIKPKREEINLTVDELIDLEQKHLSHESLSKAIEAKLKEKNT